MGHSFLEYDHFDTSCALMRECVCVGFICHPQMPATGMHANVRDMPFVDAYVHNVGLCMSEKVRHSA
jgi:hypothetical protein